MSALGLPHDAHDTLSGKPPAAIWSMPREPGAEITAVRDKSGTVWRRVFDPETQSFMWSYEDTVLWGWLDLLDEHGPLADATEEQQ